MGHLDSQFWSPLGIARWSLTPYYFCLFDSSKCSVFLSPFRRLHTLSTPPPPQFSCWTVFWSRIVTLSSIKVEIGGYEEHLVRLRNHQIRRYDKHWMNFGPDPLCKKYNSSQISHLNALIIIRVGHFVDGFTWSNPTLTKVPHSMATNSSPMTSTSLLHLLPYFL